MVQRFEPGMPGTLPHPLPTFRARTHESGPYSRARAPTRRHAPRPHLLTAPAAVLAGAASTAQGVSHLLLGDFRSLSPFRPP